MTSTKSEITDQERLQQHVDSIAKSINDCFEGEEYKEEVEEGEEEFSAYTYLEDVLDIQYIVNSDKTYRSARILVAFGGPNIWVNLDQGIVDGHWWGSAAKANISGDFCDELDATLEDIYNC